MPEHILQIKAAVQICRELTKAPDSQSRKAIIALLHTVRRRLAPTEEKSAVSTLGRRILRVLCDQRLKARSIARLCGLQYSGRFRGELSKLVKAGLVSKSGTHYEKCPRKPDSGEIPKSKT